MPTKPTREPRPAETKSTATQWQRQNRTAIEDWNEYVEKHGLPLAEYRQF